MAETKLTIATLGTREEVISVQASCLHTQGDNTTSVTAITFDNPYVNAPKIVAVNSQATALKKAVLSATDITKTGMNVNIHQYLTAEVASGTYEVNVVLVGWKAA